MGCTILVLKEDHICIERISFRMGLLNQSKRDDLSIGNDLTDQQNCIYLLTFR